MTRVHSSELDSRLPRRHGRRDRARVRGRRSVAAKRTLVGGKRDEHASRGLRIEGQRLGRRGVPCCRRAARRTRGCAGRRPCACRRSRARWRQGERAAPRIELDPHAAPRRHLVCVPEEAEARHVGDGVRCEGPESVGRRAVERSHGGDGSIERAVGSDRRAAPAARARFRAPSSGRVRLPASHRSSARRRSGGRCRRRRGRTSAPRPGSYRPPTRSRRCPDDLVRATVRIRRASPQEAPPGTPRSKREHRPAAHRENVVESVVAAITPKSCSRGSSTTGRKKSTMKTIARSSSSRKTAASSAGYETDEELRGISTGTKPASGFSSRAAGTSRRTRRPSRASQVGSRSRNHVYASASSG